MTAPEMDAARAAAASRKSWDAALARHCAAHDAAVGVPCWPMPAGMCGPRIRAAGYRGKTSDHASKANPRLTPKTLDRKLKESRR